MLLIVSISKITPATRRLLASSADASTWHFLCTWRTSRTVASGTLLCYCDAYCAHTGTSRHFVECRADIRREHCNGGGGIRYCREACTHLDNGTVSCRVGKVISFARFRKTLLTHKDEDKELDHCLDSDLSTERAFTHVRALCGAL